MYQLICDNRRKDKPYLRNVVLTTTGFDVMFGTEAQAFRFASRSVAINIRNALKHHGDFYPVEEK